MKYNEFIHVNNEFNPVYDLENEKDNSWKLFITNDKFNEILSSVIDSLDVNKNKPPIWLQGTYGTGKSHATSVIKHLISDEDISLFDLKNNQLTAKLNTFRENNNVLPVVLKGTATIGTPEKFRITIQNAVKNTLKKHDMRVTVPSDFEHILKLLEEKTIRLNEKDIEGTSLEAYNMDEIKLRLENQEADILIAIEDILEKKRLGSIQNNIVKWLTDVKKELKKEYDIDYIMIFWDEFTGALNQINVQDILLEIQNIAEANNQGISLFIVSHRTRSTQNDVNEENIEKIMDRFKKVNYSMETVATYELMEKSITKDEEWENVKNRYIRKIKPLIRRINKKDISDVSQALENLYPIHPYTSYLATFIARELGSTERSIFRFLHDDTDNGFKEFIDTYEIDDRYFLTAEYLWDFFYNDFEEKDDDENISSAVNHYKLHFEKLNNKGIEYLTIFKVILLLNILYKLAEVKRGDLTVPSRENITEVFVGSIYEEKVDDVLNYIDKQSIINETPEGYFELTTNMLDQTQVAREIEKIQKNIKLNNILDTKQLSKLKNNFDKKSIREIEIVMKEGNIPEARLRNELEKGIFKKAGFIHMLMFLCKNEQELLEIKNTIKSLSEKGLLKNIIVVISESTFKDNNLNKFIKFMASAEVCRKNNYKEDIKLHVKRANKISEDWVNKIRTGMIHWYLNEKQEKTSFSEFSQTINDRISKEIFYNGLENIHEAKSNKNIWPYKHPKIQAKHYINSRNYNELKENLNERFLSILKDNNGNLIVNSNLEIQENIPDSHPIKIMEKFVDKQFEKAQEKGEFNLGHVLKPLNEEPYGLYPSEVNIAAFSLIMRKYIDKLYDNNGNSITSAQMEDLVINTFEFWGKNKKEEKLRVRFGSEDEKKLIDMLINIFNLEISTNKKSIKEVRWNIKQWIKENKTPLWLFKQSEKMTPSLEKAFDNLNNLLRPEDGAIPDKDICDCYDEIKTNKFDFEEIINSNKKELMKKYILNINDSITPEDIPEIINNLKTMPEEVYDWKESDLKVEILNWIINENKKSEQDINISEQTTTQTTTQTPNQTTQTTTQTPNQTTQTTTQTPNQTTQTSSLITKIEQEDAETVKQVTITILNENKEFKKLFKEYFEG